ncbi:MAG: PocR ligand-binding domain-containing protein [Clostridia bacterium]|nr:PocR ligand-binding domain-containing protein [Clostridia bacterium]
MIISYDYGKANKILNDFYNATGINMVLLKSDFTPLTDRFHWDKNAYCKSIQATCDGKKMCLMSDSYILKECLEKKTSVSHMCHAGLIDVAVPIIFEDTVIGYIMFGQIRSDVSFKSVRKHIIKLGADPDIAEKLYSEIPPSDTEKIESISHIAEIIAKHILLEKTLTLRQDQRLTEINAYIEENLGTNITVQSISAYTNISKSALYNLFHENYKTTLKDYINDKRVKKAEHLLLSTDLSVENISQITGFSGVSYFGKIFKQKTGKSPLKYRKETKK